MNSYSLKNTYKNLLVESMIDKSTFLIEVLNYVEKNPIEKSNILIILLENVAKELDIKSIISSGDKKARKKAEVVVHKKLLVVEGMDGSPFSFKDISPLYTSIINYISTEKEVSINDALIASDYYMKRFYGNADSSEQSLVAKGKMKIDDLIKKVSYYKNISKKLEDIKIEDSSVYKIFEDKSTRIVYPESSRAFNNFIDINGYDVPWCTQNPSTWQAYNSDQLVMIAVDKKHKEIISLKVALDGEIIFHKTCDYVNNYMTENEVMKIIGVNGRSAVKEMTTKVNINNETYYDLKTYLEYVKKFIDVNEHDVIKDIVSKIEQYSDDEDFGPFIEEILSYASDQNKKEKILDIFADSFTDVHFNLGFEFDWEKSLEKTSSNIYFCNKVLETAQNKRSHVRYFYFLCGFFSTFDKYTDINARFRELLLISLDKNNVANFEKILDFCLENMSYRFLPSPHGFHEIFETKGLQNYAKQNKGEITKWSSAYGTKTYESYLTDIFLGNKEKTKNLLEGLGLDLEAADVYLLNKNFTKFRGKRFFEKIFNFKNSFLSFEKDDLDIIQQKVYSDLETVKLLDTGIKKKNKILTLLLSEFITAYKNGSDKMIDTSSTITFEIFKYLLENTVVHRDIDFDFDTVISVLDENNYGAENFLGLVPLLLSDKYYKSIYTSNKISDAKSLEFYLKALNIAFKEINLNVYSSLIIDSVEYSKQNDIISNTSLSYKDNFALKVINYPSLKEFFLNKESYRDKTNDFKFDPYIYFCLLVINQDHKVTSDDFRFFLESFSGSKRSMTLVAKFLAKSTSKDMIESLLQHKKTAQKIVKNNFIYNQLIIPAIFELNSRDICIDKRILSNIISKPLFAYANDELRNIVYENFINLSTSYGRNKLGNSERIVVRDCLASGIRKNQRHLETDSDLILSYCNNLDKHSKFQMRIVFPKKGMLSQEQEVVEESLIRSYIRLLLT